MLLLFHKKIHKVSWHTTLLVVLEIQAGAAVILINHSQIRVYFPSLSPLVENREEPQSTNYYYHYTCLHQQAKELAMTAEQIKFYS